MAKSFELRALVVSLTALGPYSYGEFLATFRDIPEAITGVTTLKEALVLAADALSFAIESLLEDGLPVPTPSLRQ